MWQWVLTILAGYLIAVLVNYLADALPYQRSIVSAKCGHCGSTRSFFTYFPWPRTCSDCHEIRIRHYLVILVSIVSISLIWNTNITSINPFISTLLFTYFCLVFVIDVEHRLILHVTSAFGLVIGVITGISLGHTWLHTLLGLLTGLVVMYLLYLLGMLFVLLLNRFREEQIDEVALGFGDVVLSGIIGAILGWPGIWAGLFLAILIGGVSSLGYLIVLRFKGRYVINTVLPYGPYLILATIVLLILRDYL